MPGDIELPVYDPFAGIDQRIAEATALRADDKAWLVDRLDQLQDQYQQLTVQDVRRVIHGDAWQGNVAVAESAQPILVDLEHVSLGHPDWDLIPIAVDYKDFARLRDEDYGSFVAAYGGHDVIATSGFRTMADIQELRWVCFVLSKIDINDDAAQETQHRLACLRGDVPRPWTWTAF